MPVNVFVVSKEKIDECEKDRERSVLLFRVELDTPPPKQKATRPGGVLVQGFCLLGNILRLAA